MAGIRMTGLASGLDTQSLVGELSKAYQKRVDNSKKAQTKAEWKKQAWASLNTKLTDFYKGALSTFKTTGTYKAKSVSGTLSGVKVTAGNNAVNGNHKVKVIGTASAQMWTGKQINSGTVTATSYTSAEGSTKLSELTDSDGNSILNSLNGAEFKISKDGVESTVNLDIAGNLSGDSTVEDLTSYINSQLSGSGVAASYTDGKLTFTNNNSEEVKISAENTQAKAFGVADGDGITIAGHEDGSDAVSASGSEFAYKETRTPGSAVSGSTRISDLMGADWTGSTSLTVNGETVTIDQTTTLDSLAKAMAGTGINANYDSNQGRFYLSSTNTGVGNSFDVTGDSGVIAALGLDLADGDPGKIAASSASIEYNGVTYTSDTNNFNINGLTFDVSEKGETMTFSVDNDVDGIYNKVKDFLKQYNSLLKEMTTLYNAESSRGYEPLTSDEKDEMSEDEVKEWEKKIKDSLLRRDDRLSAYTTNFRNIMNKSIEVDGKKYSLSSFGINTGDWSERGLLHLDGDPDDTTTSGNEDKLKAAIAANPEAVTKTLAGLGNELYSYLMKAQAKTTTSSSQTFYDDLTLDADIKTKKEDVKKMQQKMQDEEDKYYKQFSAMESAMAKLQSQQSYLAGLFGSTS
jgi:flagellar hook-associated protein 2